MHSLSNRSPSSGALRSCLRRWGASAVFGVWFAATSLLGAWTVAQHVLPLPEARPTAVEAGPRPQAWHVLGSDCGCSASVADELAARRPRDGWIERVWLVGDEPEIAAQLREAGFAVERVDPEVLAREHGIQGAPWLVLFETGGRTAYSGGYSRGRPGVAGSVSALPALMAAVESGEAPAALPAYGCATSETLRQRLDPLHLKYSSP